MDRPSRYVRPSIRSNPAPNVTDRAKLNASLEHATEWVAHSHSIVAGGFEEISYTTRFTPFTSLMIRVEMRASRSYGKCVQSAVIKSSVVTQRTARALSYVRASPITPTDCTGSSTANA